MEKNNTEPTKNNRLKNLLLFIVLFGITLLQSATFVQSAKNIKEWCNYISCEAKHFNIKKTVRRELVSFVMKIALILWKALLSFNILSNKNFFLKNYNNGMFFICYNITVLAGFFLLLKKGVYNSFNLKFLITFHLMINNYEQAREDNSSIIIINFSKPPSQPLDSFWKCLQSYSLILIKSFLLSLFEIRKITHSIY